MLTILRSGVFVALVVSGTLAAESICPKGCLADQTRSASRTKPCHGDAASPARATVKATCCSAPAVLRARVDVPPLVLAQLVAVDQPAVLAPAAPAVHAATTAIQRPPPLYLVHHSFLI